MEHFTEFLIIMTNVLLFATNIGLIVVTGIDHRALARIAALAIAMISPKRVVKIERTLKSTEDKSRDAQHNV